jgi:hypothetical protein
MLNNTNKTPRAAIALRSLAVNWGFTNATQGNHPELIRLFNVETCEVCDCEIEAANALQVGATLEDATRAGLTVGHRLEEGGHCEAIGVTTCSACYTD